LQVQEPPVERAARVDAICPLVRAASRWSRAGEVKLQVPKLRSLPFETAIIERYRRREASVEEALVEMIAAPDTL
jgi:hypothetical protein